MSARFAKIRSRESGQSFMFLAISIVVLMTIAALAIDLTALYTARSQAQRTADAAALAGAKGIADSGVTTAPNDVNMRLLARDLAQAYINTVLASNTVGGASPTLVGSPTPFFPGAPDEGNPTITVTVRQANVPLYFAKVLGHSVASVTASATAEAYNSSNPGSAGINSMRPVAPSCIKPWIIPNIDPRHSGDQFVDHTNGTLVHAGPYPAGIVGEQITLLDNCQTAPVACVPIDALPIANRGGVVGTLDYMAVSIASASGPCPSCAGGTPYQIGSSCCDITSNYSCGGSAPGVLIDLTTNILTDTVSSLECLIGASSYGSGAGQDEIGLGTGAQAPADSFGNFLASNGRDPIEIRAGSGPHNGQDISTSRSIVTLPIYDANGVLSLVAPVKIIGYMQAFVERTDANANVSITILNVSGCGPNVNTGVAAVSGGGVSPVPVRLIHN